MKRSRVDSALLFVTAVAAGAFLGARPPGEIVRASLLSHFQLDTVAMRGLSRVPALEVATASGLAPGVPLGEIDIAAVEARVRRHPWIREAHATALPPARLLVDVVERQPIATTVLGAPGRLWLVDETGQPFIEATPEQAESLPVLRIEGTPEAETARVLGEGLRVLALLEDHSLPAAAELWLGPEDAAQGLTLRLRGESSYVVLGRPPYGSKLARLARLRSESPREAAGATTIDLRFTGRVVLRNGPFLTGGEATEARSHAPLSRRHRSG